MSKVDRIIAGLLLATGGLAALVSSGCAARVRYYDDYHHDYHHWNHDEDAHFRLYLNEHHENYRAFGTLARDQQTDYWKWRHDHP